VAAGYLRQPDRRTSILPLDAIEEAVDPALGIDEQMVVDEMNACIRGVIDFCLRLPRRPDLHDARGKKAKGKLIAESERALSLTTCATCRP
jgi:hypothetical protein